MYVTIYKIQDRVIEESRIHVYIYMWNTLVCFLAYPGHLAGAEVCK